MRYSHSKMPITPMKISSCRIYSSNVLSLNMTAWSAQACGPGCSIRTYCLHERAQSVQVVQTFQVLRLFKHHRQLLDVVLPFSVIPGLPKRVITHLADDMLDSALSALRRLCLHP